jgi:hypothetical protein
MEPIHYCVHKSLLTDFSFIIYTDNHLELPCCHYVIDTCQQLDMCVI